MPSHKGLPEGRSTKRARLAGKHSPLPSDFRPGRVIIKQANTMGTQKTNMMGVTRSWQDNKQARLAQASTMGRQRADC